MSDPSLPCRSARPAGSLPHVPRCALTDRRGSHPPVWLSSHVQLTTWRSRSVVCCSTGVKGCRSLKTELIPHAFRELQLFRNARNEGSRAIEQLSRSSTFKKINCSHHSATNLSMLIEARGQSTSGSVLRRLSTGSSHIQTLLGIGWRESRLLLRGRVHFPHCLRLHVYSASRIRYTSSANRAKGQHRD